MKIYTKTGDDGTTGLYGGDRILKTHARIRAIGDVDELNSCVGVARLYAKGSPLQENLAQVQDWLFDLGAELGCPPESKFNVEIISPHHIMWLETSIDSQSQELPELKFFILPGGTPLATHLHVARSVCRRAERSVLEMHSQYPVREVTRTFLNRLSDWFFVSARTANHQEDVSDIAWRKTEVQ